MIRKGLLADIHIRIDGFPVSSSWNYKRLMKLADNVNAQDIDEVWIIGDLFDRGNPTAADLVAAKYFIDEINVDVKYLNGNHERQAKYEYVLHQVEELFGIEELPQMQTIEGVSIVSLGHERIEDITAMPEADLLLSHFRWSHPVFGEGELTKSMEKTVTKQFTRVLLGDIHYDYEPEDNVMYISSPYSINFGSMKAYGMMVVEFGNGMFNPIRVPLDLPCKISMSTTLNLVNGLMEATEAKHLYRFKVDLRLDDLGKFNSLKKPSNVELLPNIVEKAVEEVESYRLDISGDIKSVFMDTLSLPKEDKGYIADLLKEN